MIQQQEQADDPMRQMQMEKARLELAQLRDGKGNVPSSVEALKWRAEQAGLVPGTPEYQSFILNEGGAPATFRALDMQAQAAGFKPGTPEYNEFMATRGAGLSAGAAQSAKNEADIATGGAAAGAVDLGKETIKVAMDSYRSVAGVQKNISNINTAIDAIDSGAKSGAIAKYFPDITLASAELGNAMKMMGLDIIGSVTFGALSEGEMNLAMETAVPQNLSPPELREWLVKKKAAQEKVAQSLMEAAYFLMKPGNTPRDWMDQVRNARPEAPPPPPSAPAPGAPAGDGWTVIDGVRIREKQ
jgi:hypothetical protein